jgi:signal transduction histidine kinase/PAS domain-containing protein
MHMETHAGILELRAALRDLVAISTIPAAWVGREPPAIAAGLADVLLGSLGLDFAFVRLCDPNGGSEVEATRGNGWSAFPKWLSDHSVKGAFSCKEIVPDIGRGGQPCRGVVIPIGVNAEAGLAAAACGRADFPNEIDQLLLSVAANHAAAAFQDARLRNELDAKAAELRQARDNLEMKVAERTADLRRSEAYLAEAQRVSHTGSFGWSVSSGDIVWSDEAFRIFEYDLACKPSLELIMQRTHPEDRAFVQETIDQAARDPKGFDVEHRLLLPDGSVKYVRVLGHPSTNDKSGNFEFVGAVMDVTERKRAEALRDGESRILEMIARDAPLEETLTKLVLVVEAQFAGLLCSILLLDEDGQHLRHGAAPSLPRTYTEAINGLVIGPKAGSCGTAMYRREPIVVTDILQDPLWEEYREVAEPYGFRACWSTPILAHSGKALGSFAMYYREPCSPRSAETQALQMATHLAGIAIERKLAREERERLRQVQAELAHMNRVTTMGELTASLAHEIKQPITAAVTDARTCLRWLGRDNPDLSEARDAVSRVVTDVTRAAEIISRISLLFKKGGLQRELVDINDLIGEMVVLLRNEAARYSISIRSDLAEGLPKVLADRIQLQQVFMNLMLNGIEAMEDLGTIGELTISSQQAEASQLLVSVGDTGVGLQPDEGEKVFNAFYTTKDQGTGMGLPISRSIIESHGGRMWVAPNSGRGSIFQFTLPCEVIAHQAA